MSSASHNNGVYSREGSGVAGGIEHERSTPRIVVAARAPADAADVVRALDRDETTLYTVERSDIDANLQNRTDSAACLVYVDDDLPDRLATLAESTPTVCLDSAPSLERTQRALDLGVDEYIPWASEQSLNILADRCTQLIERMDEFTLLATRNRHFENLLDDLPGMVYRCRNDEDWTMQFVSAGVQSLTGYDPEALTTGEVSYGKDVIHPEDQAAVWEGVQDALADREPFQLDYRIITADEQLKWVWEQGRGDFDGKEVTALQGFITDITERRTAREELAEQNRRLDEFAAVVSHDLRNPLNVAKGRLELACEEVENDHLDTARDALDRMDDLIDDLLTLARQGAGVNSVESVGLDELAEECWRGVRTGVSTLRVEDDLTLQADPGRLSQLLENLFRNAVEHGAGPVAVEVGALSDENGFYVADDGPGIPLSQRDRVFEAGYTTTESGTGFGLAIVRDVASAHGWSVAVTDAETGGTRFEISGVTLA